MWKTAIPGKGYSSPIVTQEAVYVTTGYTAEPDPAALTGFRWAVLVGLCLITALTLPGIFRYTVTVTDDHRRLSQLASAAGGLVLLILLCGAVLFAEVLLDFGSAVEKPWTAAALIATLTLGLTASRSNAVWAGWVAQIALAVLLAVTIPDRHHTIASNPFSAVSLLIYAVILLPTLVGATQLLTGHSRVKVSRPNRKFMGLVRACLGIVGFGGLFFLLGSALRYQHAETDRTISEAAYKPVLQGAAFWGTVLLLGIPLAYGLRRGASQGRNAAVVGCGAALVFFLLFAAAEQLRAQVPYLSYLLASPNSRPLLGWGAVLAVVASGLAAVLRTHFWKRRSSPTATSPSVGIVEWEGAALLPIVGVLFTAVYFVYANYVPKSPALERAVVCLNRRTGEIRWISDGLRSARSAMHSDNSPATPTPVTDGERVYAYFGTPGLLCVGSRDGRLHWANRDLPFETREGVATSPILWNGKVIILSESDAGNYLAAVNADTGKLAWRTERRQKVHSYAGNCRTPTVKRIGGQSIVVVWGQEDLSGYDPATGYLLWTHHLGNLGTGDNPVASMVSDTEHYYVLGTQRALALRSEGLLANGQGKAVTWASSLNDGVQCASPVVRNGLLFGVSDGGTAFCLDVRTGRELWYRDLIAQHYASPVATEKRVYFSSTEGETTVISCDRQGKVLARNSLDEGIYASPALVDGALFLRTTGHMYCIREQ